MLSNIMLQICLTAMASGVPCHEMLALAELESSFNPRAVGALKERGLFQVREVYFGRVPATVEGQTRQAAKIVRFVKANCQKDLTMNWVMCYNIGVTKGRSKLKTKAGPYRMNYIKLAKKWNKVYEANKDAIRLELLQSSYRVENFFAQKTVAQDY